jgi:hypothetical protein
VLTKSGFLAQHPEFKTAPGAPGVTGTLLDDMLAFAAARIDANVFGATTDEAHGWLTADLLACSPFGRKANLSPPPSKDGSQPQSMYGLKHAELVALVGSGYGLT